MKHLFLFFYFLLSIATINGQRTIEKTLEKLNKKSVPYISVNELRASENSIILDSRKKEEFTISHLKNAIWVGYKEFDINALPIKDKNMPIVVYCSIGVRSENIAEKLVASGFTNVKNLYGGIFKWVTKDYPIFDNEGNSTKKVHAFSKHWGKLLTKGEKIY